MDFEFKRTGKSFGKLWLYAVLLLCVTAAGIGSYAAMKKANSATEPQTSIDWDNQGFTLGAEKQETKVTVEWNTTSSTTEEPISARTDNLPFTGKFTLPLGNEIGKDYSDGEMVSSKTMGDWRIHNGIDFTGNSKADVLAIQDGVVTDVYSDDMWGVVVVVDHGNGMIAKYCGLVAKTTPKKGDEIKGGTTLGKLGEIPVEAADGSHLHLEITVDDVIVDPLAAMNRAD